VDGKGDRHASQHDPDHEILAFHKPYERMKRLKAIVE
jgi:hypothetical protein